MLKNLENKKICITGATGFLGSHILPLFLQHGARLTCLTRRPVNKVDSSIDKKEKQDIAWLKGDCAELATMQKLLAGQDIFIHMASLLFGNTWQDYLTANTEACQRAALAWQSLPSGQRPKKIILISSLAACAPCDQMPGISENALPSPVSAYGWSKLLSENIFRSAFGDKLVIIRPPIIYGSRDKGLLPLFKSIKKGIGISPGFRRRFPVSIIHADDAAYAISLACGEDANGIYHLSDGQYHTMQSLCANIAQALGKHRFFLLKAPLPVMAITACSSTLAGTIMQKFRNKPFLRAPNWNIDKYREAKQSGWLADAKRIQDELGFVAKIEVKKGMTETVQGYLKDGWL